MSKRSLATHDLPAPKRLHTNHTNPPQTHFSLVSSLYDELILAIFSYLSWVDLCAVQRINRNWARLALDNELWRKQYFLAFGRARLRGSRGPLGRLDNREVKPLPARARVEDPSYKDWKWMFRISSNWKKGRCSVEEIPFCSRPGSAKSHLDNHSSHLLLTGTLTITASSRPSYEPTIYVTGLAQSCRIVCKPKENVRCSITTLAMDQSPTTTGRFRLISFLSTGEFVYHQFQRNSTLNPLQSFRHTPIRRSSFHLVVQAAYHHPLLVTLSQDFTISLFNIGFETAKLTQTLSSFTSFPPVSLVLSTPSPSIYKLVLAYTIPVYPQHWTAGATELIITGPKMMASTTNPPQPDSFDNSSASEDLIVLNTRTARAVDVPFGWIDERKLRAMREQWSRKVNRVVDIRTDGKWVILAPGDQLSGLESHLASLGSHHNPSYPSPRSETVSPDNIDKNIFAAPSLHSPTNLQLYRLILPPQNSISSSPPRLSFVRTLHGQTGPVDALALSDGRCVSVGFNGSVWVWDLEAGTSAEVAAANLSSAGDLTLGPDAGPIRGSVSFDERRLIITQGDNVVVRRFDV